MTTAAHAEAPQHHGSVDDAAVLAVVDLLLSSLESKDPAKVAATTLPEGKATAAFTTPAGEKRVVIRDWKTFANALPRIPGEARERNIDPHVHVDGDIAMVWTPFVFTIDGKLSHCGTNHFDLVRKDGAWKVLNVTWSQRQSPCPKLPG